MGSMVEILQAQAGQNEWRLLLPALRRSAAGPVVLVGAPHVPFGPGLAAQGFDAQRLLCVDVQAPAARLWATEQALRCSAVFIVLVWLPQVRAEPLRRLQMAAHEHGKLLFVMRPAQAEFGQHRQEALDRLRNRAVDVLLREGFRGRGEYRHLVGTGLSGLAADPYLNPPGHRGPRRARGAHEPRAAQARA